MSIVRRSLLVAMVVSEILSASPASAATVSVELDANHRSFNEVRYVAGPGETNRLTAHYAADALSVTVMDPGAIITALESCTSTSPHSAVCTAPDPPFPIAGPYVQSVRALLGDRNDSVVTTRPGPYPIGGVKAFGGAGDDVLNGSPVGDFLDGGAGSDVLVGGGGGDTLSYRHRTRGVVVDLATDHPAGEPGEGDRATEIESVQGGAGDDLLAGDDSSNDLDGGEGENRLIGRGGSDVLRHATGPIARCGRGFDVLTGPRPHTRVSSCERLPIVPPRDARGSVETGATVRPTPRRVSGALVFDVTCPDADGETLDCRSVVRVHSRSGHRLLGFGRLDAGPERRVRFLRLELTAVGRRLYQDSRRQLATTVMRGPLMRRTAWTIGF